jgi:hypothetical protein
MLTVSRQVEPPHTNLSEITRMELVHVGTMVMHTTSQTTTTRMLAVLSNATVTGGDVSALLATMVQASWLCRVRCLFGME